MSNPTSSSPSFTPASRWKIGFNLGLRSVLVIAVVVMINYLGAIYFHRFFFSAETRVALSSRTLDVLHSMTNSVQVTLYYDTKDQFFPEILALLKEYQDVNPHITIRTVDYMRDAGAAEKVKAHYKLYGAADKNLVIFESNGRWKIYSGDALTRYSLKEVPNAKERQFRRVPVAFLGERVFTAMLLALENPHPLKAYFLQGDGEPSIKDTGDFGYMKFASTLEEDYVAVKTLNLQGNQGVPLDCNLLIIAAPQRAFSQSELDKISKYLSQGGRLMVLFNYASLKHPTGLESVLRQWGLNVVPDIVQDPKNTVTGQDVVVRRFGKHSIISSLAQLSLQMVLPRPVEKAPQSSAASNSLHVSELAFSGSDSRLENDPGAPPRSYPLIAAVEKKPTTAVDSLRGTTRIVVAGDSIFLGNYYIDGAGNRAFLNSAANWLLDRPQLVSGIGPRPVTEFRLLLTKHQKQQLRWLLLGALPGGVLLFGCLVWLVRRK